MCAASTSPGIGTMPSPQQAREAMRSLKYIADTHKATNARFGIMLSQRQSQYVLQQTLRDKINSFRLLAQTTWQLSEQQVPKRQHGL